MVWNKINLKTKIGLMIILICYLFLRIFYSICGVYIYTYSIDLTYVFSILVIIYILLNVFNLSLLFIFFICYLIFEIFICTNFIFNFTYFKCHVIYTLEYKQYWFLEALKAYLDCTDSVSHELKNIVYQNIQQIFNQGFYDNWLKQSDTTLTIIKNKIPVYVEEQVNLIKEAAEKLPKKHSFYSYFNWDFWQTFLQLLSLYIFIPKFYAFISFNFQYFSLYIIITDILSRANFTIFSVEQKLRLYNNFLNKLFNMSYNDLLSFWYYNVIKWNTPSTPLLHSSQEILINLNPLNVFLILWCFVLAYYTFVFLLLWIMSVFKRRSSLIGNSDEENTRF